MTKKEYYGGVTAEDYGLKEVHSSLIRTLDVLDDICWKNNIRYSIHAGTLLGAVRNSKIIPWDDDVDISMTRENYLKFEEACRELTGAYFLNKIDTWVPRFVEKNEDMLTFIDIFIWDYISENRIAQKAKYLILRTLQGMLKRNICYKDYSMVYQFLLIVTKIMGKLLSRKKKISLYNYAAQKMFQGKRMLIHRSNDRFYDMMLISPKEIMESYTNIELEGHKYMVNQRWQEILIQSYGENYLTPPPLRKRKPMHEKQRKNFLSK